MMILTLVDKEDLATGNGLGDLDFSALTPEAVKVGFIILIGIITTIGIIRAIRTSDYREAIATGLISAALSGLIIAALIHFGIF